MAKMQVDNLKQMQIDLKHAIREYYLTDNKEAILIIQELATKMAILHGYESNSIVDADEYAIRLDEHCRKMAMNYSYKAVFILGLLGNAKEIKPKTIDEMAKWFVRYYAKRIRKEVKPEKDGLFCQEKPDHEQVVKYLTQTSHIKNELSTLKNQPRLFTAMP